LELQGRHAGGRLEIVEGERTETRNGIEVFKDHYVVKEDAKSVVWRGAGFHDLIEKAQIVESARRSSKGLADGVKIRTSRTKEGAESIVGGTGPTPKSLPIGAGMVVQPAKVPVSKSPLIMRLPAEVSGAAATSRRPTAKRQLARELFMETRSYEQKKI